MDWNCSRSSIIWILYLYTSVFRLFVLFYFSSDSCFRFSFAALLSSVHVHTCTIACILCVCVCGPVSVSVTLDFGVPGEFSVWLLHFTTVGVVVLCFFLRPRCLSAASNSTSSVFVCESVNVVFSRLVSNYISFILNLFFFTTRFHPRFGIHDTLMCFVRYSQLQTLDDIFTYYFDWAPEPTRQDKCYNVPVRICICTKECSRWAAANTRHTTSRRCIEWVDVE